MADGVTPIYPEGREDRRPLHPSVSASVVAMPGISDELLAPFEGASPRELGALVLVLFQALQASLGHRHFLDVLDIMSNGAPDRVSHAMVRAVRKAITEEE